VLADPASIPSGGFDWLLLGVKTQVDGRNRIWFVRVSEIVDPIEAAGGRPLQQRRFEYSIPFGVVGAIAPAADFAIRCRRLLVEVYDEAGVFMSSASRLAPVVFPESTLFHALASLPVTGPVARAPLSAVNSVDPRGLGSGMEAAGNDVLRDESLYGMVAVLQAIGTTPPMLPIRELVKSDVVEVPSMLSLLFSGLRPTLRTTMTTAQALEFPWVLGRVNVPCYEAGFATYLAGERFFDCRIIAGPSVPPCDLLGGLLVIEAAHPRKPENRLTIRVLASNRTQPQWSPDDVPGYRGTLAQR
jgi:hypothetical protein